MAPVFRSRIRVRLEFDNLDDLSIMHRKERDCAIGASTVCYRDVTDSFVVVSNNRVDGELPAPMSRVLLIHQCEVVPAADPFLRLRPVQDERITQQVPYRPEIVRLHALPECC